MLDKQNMIAAIKRINPSADSEWLKTFHHDELQTYLNRLDLLQGPRDVTSGWVRRSHLRAVVTRRPAA